MSTMQDVDEEVRLVMFNTDPDDKVNGKDINDDDDGDDGDADGQTSDKANEKPKVEDHEVVSMALPTEEMGESEDEVRNLKFKDGVRRIDFVLAWSVEEDKNEKKIEQAKEARRIFEENLMKEGLEIEKDERGNETHFAKIHAPIEVLKRYADILKIRMPMREELSSEHIQERYADWKNKRKILYDHWASWRNCLKFQPVDHVRLYFGEKIALYFAWLGFYTTMLVPASAVGLCVFFYGLSIMSSNAASQEVCDPNNNIIMCPLCDAQCPYWRLSEACTHVKEPPRPEFLSKLENWNHMKVNPVTGLKEPHLPFWRRRFPIFLTSYTVMLLLAALAVAAVIGVIAYRVSMLAALQLIPGRVVSNHTVVTTTAGLIYENASLVTTVTAALINLLIIILLNMVYGYLAFWLTDWECLRTQSEYDNSITIKLFILQFVNYFSSIIYIAFFKGRFVGRPGKYRTIFGGRQEECEAGGCLIELCIQLAIIMVGKQLIQNNFIEIVVPKIIKLIKRKLAKETREQKLAKTAWEKDYILQPAQSMSLFYEYLEMVLQYGFLTIFCAAFPLAPLFALLNNIIEIRVDATKFTTDLRRPLAEKSANIGIWYSVLYGISRIAIISN
ncbi:anoctamin, partial [Elysia marginata]